MYTYLSSHVYIISYTNNTYVLFQMLQVSPQHCCRASYQIAKQFTIVNLVALRGSWGIFWIITWNRIGDKLLYRAIKITLRISYRSPVSGSLAALRYSSPGMLQKATLMAWSIGRANYMYVRVKSRTTVDIFNILWGMGSNLIMFIRIHLIHHPW